MYITELTHTKSTQGRNLTGSARHIRDLIADIHKNIQIWNTLHLEGVTLLNNITQAKQDESYSETLQEQCDKLEIVCDGLVMHFLHDYFLFNIIVIKIFLL